MQPKDLLNKAKSPKVAFHKFVLLHREHGTDLFCFFEGKDTQYYFPRIDNVIENHQPIKCGNKKSVIEAYDFIKIKYPKFKTKFFIDSDFDENEEKKDMYITCGYSIENFYCSENVLSKILINEFFLDKTDEVYMKILDIFRKRQKEFHKETSLFNLWYFTAKLKAKEQGTIVNACLNEKFPKDFLSITFENITSSYTLNDIKLKFPDAIEVNEKELEANKKKFFTKEPQLLFRGKYELEFMIKFLNFLINDANKNKKYLKSKTKFRIDPAICLSQISQYADTTEELKKFIKNCA